MSIDKKALIAQITENVRVPLVQEGSHQEQKPALEQKRPRVSRVKSKPVAPAAAGTSSGRQAAFWLDDEDRAIFREVGMNLYSQGIKPSDNLVLRAALRLMPRDHRLIDQIRILLENDGRKLRHRRNDS
jgi:NAD(P)H-dependent FMN reductase